MTGGRGSGSGGDGRGAPTGRFFVLFIYSFSFFFFTTAFPALFFRPLPSVRVPLDGRSSRRAPDPHKIAASRGRRTEKFCETDFSFFFTKRHKKKTTKFSTRSVYTSVPRVLCGFGRPRANTVPQLYAKRDGSVYAVAVAAAAAVVCALTARRRRDAPANRSAGARGNRYDSMAKRSANASSRTGAVNARECV